MDFHFAKKRGIRFLFSVFFRPPRAWYPFAKPNMGLIMCPMCGKAAAINHAYPKFSPPPSWKKSFPLGHVVGPSLPILFTIQGIQ